MFHVQQNNLLYKKTRSTIQLTRHPFQSLNIPKINKNREYVIILTSFNSEYSKKKEMKLRFTYNKIRITVKSIKNSRNTKSRKSKTSKDKM